MNKQQRKQAIEKLKKDFTYHFRKKIESRHYNDLIMFSNEVRGAVESETLPNALTINNYTTMKPVNTSSIREQDSFIQTYNIDGSDVLQLIIEFKGDGDDIDGFNIIQKIFIIKTNQTLTESKYYPVL